MSSKEEPAMSPVEVEREDDQKPDANEGLCQILFFQGDEPCETSYKDKHGKYQKQTGIVLPKL